MEWLTVSEQFEEKWQYPNGVGEIDGKNIVIISPTSRVSHYYNYKHTNSIVLHAIAGPNYECLFADVGSNGIMNDSGIWNKSKIESGDICFSEPQVLPYGTLKVPVVLIGDDAFALKHYMMKPYPQRNLSTETEYTIIKKSIQL